MGSVQQDPLNYGLTEKISRLEILNSPEITESQITAVFNKEMLQHMI